MEIRILAPGDALWSRASDYAAACPWPGGADLAKRMRANEFADWERVFLALDGESPAGFCALSSGGGHRVYCGEKTGSPAAGLPAQTSFVRIT